jgi:ubiquinone/menaquinone biosynthesis C-methylase UbiE
MKKKNQYDGWELQSFDRATNFRTYQIEKIRKFIKNKKILDIGSGNGGLIKYYLKRNSKYFYF